MPHSIIPRIAALTLALSLITFNASCGYHFKEKSAAPTPSNAQEDHKTSRSDWNLYLQNHSLHPGLSLSLRRALMASAKRRGLSFKDTNSEKHANLHVVISQINDQATTIARIERGTLNSLAATGHEVRIWLDVTLQIPQHPPLLSTFQGSAMFSDRGLPLATERAREAAIPRALHDASEDLILWLIATMPKPQKPKPQKP